ncbi:MAG: sugar transferase [Candidatus Acinetobacter avistercoris]|nr:sugar transferase [Candidatus Acinetobacter avistercoris]
MFYKLYLKRFIDLVFATIIFILLSPIFMLVMLVLSSANKGSPFFFQLRPGKNGKIFKIIKFKTMSDAKDESENLLPDFQRITKVGSFIRKTSLDEIPQLINVIKGDMSIVGPRPLLVEYLPLYSEEQALRHNVRPGMTGYAQVNGRNAISWEEKFKLDTWYVENQSFWLDFKIMLKTVKKVIAKDDISAEGDATMPKFTGNLKK